ncbi:hypothetical protein Hanom_Chr12g01139521 [Helianthus anomalus]
MVGVMVGEGKPINEEVTLLWENKKFKVWIAEETSDWILDFLEGKDAGNGDLQADYFGVNGVRSSGNSVGSSPVDGGKSHEDVEPCMQEMTAHDTPVEFPRWDDIWNKEIINVAQDSIKGALIKKVNCRSKVLGPGKAKNRNNSKAHNVFVSGLGQDRSKKRLRTDDFCNLDSCVGPEEVSGGSFGENIKRPPVDKGSPSGDCRDGSDCRQKQRWGR